MIKIFSSILEINEKDIKDDVSPKNTKKWDSLNHLKIIMEIENTFNIELLPEEAIDLFSFKDSLELVRKKMENKFSY